MFCGLGTDPQAWQASGINAGELRDQAAGPALAGPLTFLPSVLTHHQRHRSPAVPPPSAGSRAPRLPDLTDFDSDPLLHYVSLEFLRAPGISLPLPLRARRLYRTISTVQPAFITTVRLFDSAKNPHKRLKKTYPPALPGRKHQILTAGIPASSQTSRLSSRTGPFLPPRAKGCSLLPSKPHGHRPFQPGSLLHMLH